MNLRVPKHVVARRYIDDIDGEVGKLRREGCGKVVAARFDDDQVEVGKRRIEIGNGGKID